MYFFGIYTALMDYYLSIVLFCFVSATTLGPNNIMLMTSGLNYDIKKFPPHFVGISAGFPIMVTNIGSGFGALFLVYPIIHKLIKIIDIAYLLYLAWKIANTKNPSASENIKKPIKTAPASS